MAQRINEHGQPVGAAIEGWVARPRPPLTPHCRDFRRGGAAARRNPR